mgnify:CR=1 FL=1
MNRRDVYVRAGKKRDCFGKEQEYPRNNIITRGKNGYYEKENNNKKENRAEGEEDFEIESFVIEEEGYCGEKESDEAYIKG